MATPRSALCAWLALSTTVLAVPALASADEAGRSSGGAIAPVRPAVDSVTCEPTPTVPCPSGGALARGGRVTIAGEELDAASRVVFMGRRGKRDDVAVRPKEVEHDQLVAVVARRARSGRVMVVNRGGQRAASRKRVRVTTASARVGDSSPATTFFYGGSRKPTFSFAVDQPGRVQVDLLREETGTVVESWDVDAVAGQPNSVEWNPAGKAPSNGRYRFRIAGGAVTARAATADAFDFYDHIFPIRGRHDLGQSATNNFGGGRNHKGQDMFAACGTKLVAARGGKVEVSAYHEAAGNYVVIDGAGTSVDYVYMHMLSAPLVAKGERVRTGQAIGEVGESGRASGCHLHFEMWSGPGWYAGGEAFDPLPQLRAWDAYS